jgi:hypothetical protein
MPPLWLQKPPWDMGAILGRQNINQIQTLQNPGPLNHGKPPYTLPCCTPFLPASWFQSCLHKHRRNRWATHTTHNSPTYPLGTLLSAAPGQIEYTTPTKLKSIDIELQSNTYRQVRVGWNAKPTPGEWGWGEEPNSQWTKEGKGAKAETRGGATSQPSKAGPVVNPWADLLGLKAILKTELPHLAGRGADPTELQL